MVDDDEVQAQEGDFYGGWITPEITGGDRGFKGGACNDISSDRPATINLHPFFGQAQEHGVGKPLPTPRAANEMLGPARYPFVLYNVCNNLMRLTNLPQICQANQVPR